jgi:hypothetical protein
MSQAGSGRRGRGRGGIGARFGLALGGAALWFAAGCQGGQNLPYDPLVAGTAIPPPPGAAGRAVAGGARGQVPPIPDRLGRAPADLTTAGREREARAPEVGTGQTSVMAASGTGDYSRAGTVDTYGQLHEQLRQRGVTWWRLERVGDTDDYKFECSVPHRDNPNIRRVYEAQAKGGFGVEAIRAVLQQIDRERRPADR